MPQKPIIRIEDLTTGYTDRGSKRPVSKGLNLSVSEGETIVLMGGNGCGKSTLMRTVAGLQPPLSGEIFVAGKRLTTLSARTGARWLSLVLTERVGAANLTVEDIVSTGRYPHIGCLGRLTDKDKAIVLEALHQCGLDGFARRYYAEMSDGERQRTMIARALAQETPVVLLDEPTAHLDLPSRIQMMRLIKALSKQSNKGILMTSHEPDLALQQADTVWLMNQSGDVCCGEPGALISAGQFTAVFGEELAPYFHGLSEALRLQPPLSETDFGDPELQKRVR